MASFLAIWVGFAKIRDPSLPHPREARMEKKCAICGILLDMPCPAFACPGHRNESVGELCAYCATNERDEVLSLRNLSPSLVSSLEDFEPDLDDE